MGMMSKCTTCGREVFHLWEHPVPPVGTKCSTCGHITMDSMDQPWNPWSEHRLRPYGGSSLPLQEVGAAVVPTSSRARTESEG